MEDGEADQPADKKCTIVLVCTLIYALMMTKAIPWPYF